MIVEILHTCFQQQYQVVGRSGGDIHPSARCRHFSDALSSKRFILRELKVGADFWRYFLQHQYSSVPTFTDLQLLHEIAQLVADERIRFYELPDISETVMLDDGMGTGYNFIKGPGKLPQIGTFPIEIDNKDQAYEIINRLNTQSDFWQNYLEKNNLLEEQQNTARKSSPDEYIADLMVSGAIVVYSQPYVPQPPAAAAVEYAPVAVFDKPVPPGPEVIKTESIYVNYQIDIDDINNVNDKITLTHNESDYVCSLAVDSLFEFDEDWVCLEFPDPPQSGTYTLIHDPQEENMEVYTVFKDVPYEKLADLTPELQRPGK